MKIHFVIPPTVILILGIIICSVINKSVEAAFITLILFVAFLFASTTLNSNYYIIKNPITIYKNKKLVRNKILEKMKDAEGKDLDFLIKKLEEL